MDIKVPNSIVEGQKVLMAELGQVVEAGGNTGSAASSLMVTLKAHIEHEEKIVLRSLGFLSILEQAQRANGFDLVEASVERVESVGMANVVKEEMPHLQAEHQAILAGVDQLSQASELEGNAEVKQLCDRLKLLVGVEKEIYYPAALLASHWW